MDDGYGLGITLDFMGIPKRNKENVKAGFFKKAIQKKIGRAIADYHMLKDGDKILVAVSGGKDSLILLKLLLERRVFVPIKYDVIACYVDLGHKTANVAVLKKYLEQQACSYHIVRKKVFKKTSDAKLTCFWCSWNRRKALFALAQKYGCNKIALGHHKDDIITTILMNLLFEGQISAMVPSQEIFKGGITLIRPLAYVEEEELQRFAQIYDIPSADVACPIGKQTKRALVRSFVEEVKVACPSVKTNIFKSIQRIKKDYLL
ncbi:MAG: ATP-binding protein [Candidatus Omnitrophota bacterium]